MESPATSSQPSRGFDLQDDGKLVQLEFPFEYYQGKEGDKFTLIHQGGYKI